ncbi:hypothetical protein K8M07_04255 [Schnuerera sp. xch1]|uniref:hypothetical protein n=1 Tax=Schnuerera sp. xch1 TaxID=2874283 RepID=UPI001CBB878D|nr:hypothetical protein [Schnuerera sp. xch1]MBZ2174454.1 hypothetical protein [Schnuerera sp. xch1]
MKQYEEKLKNYMVENNIYAEQLIFSQSCHSVQEAAPSVELLSLGARYVVEQRVPKI